MVPPGVQQAFDIPFGLPAKWQECLHLCGDQQSTFLDCPEKRFDSISIPHSDELLRGLIEEDAGKLAAQMMNKVEAIILVQGNDQFRVRMTFELVVGLGKQIGTDVVVIIELAVHYSMNGPCGIMKRLDSIG